MQITKQAIFHKDEVNRCDCGAMNWDIRGTTAECRNCHLALPLGTAYGMKSSPVIFRRGRGGATRNIAGARYAFG